MNSETKICQNCKQQFIIDSADFDFYTKINVPPPTFCPECRMQRRMQFRNLKTVYKRKTIDGKEVFSAFAPDSPFRVYSQPYWLSDACEPVAGVEYNFSKPFFSQLKELVLASPWAAGYNISSIQSDYCNNCFDVKNCYLAFNSGYSEDCAYVVDARHSKTCLDALKIDHCELSYELFDCEKCYRAFFSAHCRECSDIYFCENLTGCHDCFGSVNLKNKSYYIFNKPYTKEEYMKEVKNIWDGSISNIEKLQQQFRAHKSAFPSRFYRGYQNDNITGDYVDHSKNCRDVFYSTNLENCAHCQLVLFVPGKDSCDMTVAGGGELCYEIEEAGGHRIRFAWYAGTNKMDLGMIDVAYSMNCFNCNYLFGCVGLKNKSYCILNKQFTKEEYIELVPKIIKHMNAMPYTDNKGRVYRYGEFFPPELSPFAYNETLAQEYFPLTKEEAFVRGYRWRDPETRQYAISTNSSELPDNIKNVSDSIASEIIGCAHARKCLDQCTMAFKIILQELEFYRRMNLPVPRLCPNCRYAERIKQRNPLKLWKRRCQCRGKKSERDVYENTNTHFHADELCPNEFETSYAPDRKEVVYCEQCYQAEVA